MKMLALVALLVGCSSSPSSRPAPQPAGNAPTAQIERGKGLYVARCAKCHGDAGQGTDKGPPVVGEAAFPKKPREGAKRDVEFRTAADVFAWTVQHMPGDAPGTLATDEYLAIFAFDLTANKVELKAPLDAAAAQAIVLPP